MLHLGQIVVPGKPVSLNQERGEHWRNRHNLTSTWRSIASIASNTQMRRVPGDRYPVVIEVIPVVSGKLADAGNHYPTAKAIIDGMRDAKIIVDDDPRYVAAVLMQAPRSCEKGEQPHLTLNVWASADTSAEEA